VSALGVQHLDDVAKEIENLFKLLSAPKEGILDKLKMLPKLSQFASWMPTVKSGKGECQEIVMREPDITKLPVYHMLAKRWRPFCYITCYSYKRSEYRNKECWNV
jgi:4-hydroxy-3-polyprenylbenzoate decarboxylase